MSINEKILPQTKELSNVLTTFETTIAALNKRIDELTTIVNNNSSSFHVPDWDRVKDVPNSYTIIESGYMILYGGSNDGNMGPQFFVYNPTTNTRTCVWDDWAAVDNCFNMGCCLVPCNVGEIWTKERIRSNPSGSMRFVPYKKV